jgi:hypothetical protein
VIRRALLVLALLAVFAVRASARAGGGQSYSGHSSYSSHSSYSGSGSSSYNYGSSSSSDGLFLYYFVSWVILHPLLGVPLTLFLLYIVYSFQTAGGVDASFDNGLGENFSAKGTGQLSSRMAEEIARVRRRDPDFDAPAFLERAGKAFLKIQAAWSAGDMSSARAFISDGVNERFGRQLAAMKSRGERNLMEDVEVRETELLACRSDKHFDALWVRVAAAATDRTLDANGAEISGSPGRSAFEEIWTFLRRPGAKTLKRPGLIEGSCPSCGSPLPIADAAQCAACKTWVNSGEFDWVLAEITQSCEWTLREPSRDVDGWEAASAADPALNLPALEDRTSVIFWRWLDARRLGNSEPLRPVADAKFCAAFSEKGGWGGAFADAAVGAVEAVAFEDAGAVHLAHVAVKWSAADELRTHYFVLSRAAGAKTDARQGLRTARCPSCGAPPAERSEAACAYCGAPLNDGKKDWILTAIVPFGEWKRPAVVSGGTAAAPPVPGLGWGAEMSPADAYAVLALAMLADGEESLAEKAFLEAYAMARGLPADKADAITAAARSGRLDAPRAQDGAQAEAMLRGMVRMSLADGVVTDSELAALHAFAARFSLRPDDVAAMIAEERGELERAAA